MSAPKDIDQALCEPPELVGRALLAIDESQWFERKSARVKPRDLANLEISLGNADGGTIVVGLSEGRVEGTDSLGKGRNQLMQASVDLCRPPVAARHRLLPCVNARGEADHLLVLDVRPSDAGVHTNVNDEVYLRIGDSTRRLSYAQRRELEYDRGPAAYEARRMSEHSISELDELLLDQYVGVLGAPDAKRLLRARGLTVDDDTPNVAGWLLFGRDPQREMPEAFVRVLRYHGSERGAGVRQRLSVDVRCDGPIPRLLMRAREEVAAVQPMRRALGRGGRFEDMPLVPEDAWLEGLVNAVVHRSYSLAGDHIRVEVFDDRIEITSPGRFPGLVSLSDPLHAPRFARNPRIARVCRDLEFGQELGEGIRRIYEEMRLAGLNDPVYTETAASVRLLLSAEPTERELDEQLTPEARKVTAALRDAGRLSTGEVAELIQRSRPAAIRVLKSLESAEIIRWVGHSPKDPRAHWELVRR
jgi:ATP-dependent DNA helicase RecG